MRSEYLHKKFTRVLIALAIISIFLGSAFISASSYPKPVNSNNQTVPKSQRIGEKTEVSIILLDNPGKMLIWNQSASIYTKLVTKDGKEPIPNEFLRLYVYLHENWTLIDIGFTNESGVAEFTFSVDMENGDYQYRVSYSGGSNYLLAEERSYFTVIADPQPYITLQVDEVSDERIKFSVKVEYSPVWYLWWTWPGYLSEVIVFVDVETPPWFPLHVPGHTDEFRFQGVYWPGSDQPFIRSFDLDELTSYRMYWSTEDYGKMFHVGDVYDLGYTYVTFRISAYQKWTEWLTNEEWSESHIDRVYTLIDDDHAWPTGSVSWPESMTLQSANDYNIGFTFQDDSGWTSSYQYKFTNTTYESPIYQSLEKSTPSTSYTTLTSGIPRSIWSQYPGTTICIRYKVIDNDCDGGRQHDRNGTVSDWTGAGTIFSEIGARIDRIDAFAYVMAAQGWEWRLMRISPYPPGEHSDRLFRDLYINDENHIILTIGNPMSEDIAVIDASIIFSCPMFLTEITIPIENVGTVNAHQTRIIDVSICFNRSDFSSIDFDRSIISMRFAFLYSLSSHPSDASSISCSEDYSIVRPPQPKFSFIGFGGPMELGSFIYKYNGKDSEISARFQVVNDARIRMKVTLDSEITEASISSERDVLSCVIEKLRIDEHKEFSVNPGTSEISFLIHSESTFFLDVDLICEFIARYWLGLTPLKQYIYGFDVMSKVLDYMEFVKNAVKVMGQVEEGKKLLQQTATFFKVTGKIATAVKVLSLAWDLCVCIIAEASMDMQRNYDFVSSITWTYLNGPDGKSMTTFNDLGYSQPETTIERLHLIPSQKQLSDHAQAMAYKATAMILGLIPIEAPFTGLAASIASWIASDLADNHWKQANDDVPIDEDYTEIYQPIYPAYDLSGYEPQSEFDEALLQFINASALYTGDFVASDITNSRMEAAMDAEDYEATTDQAFALIACTDRMIADTTGLNNAVELLSYHLSEKSSYCIDEFIALESSISQNGISEQDKLALEALGLDQTEIDILNQTIISLAVESAFSHDVEDSFSLLDESVDNSTKLLSARVADLENLAEGLTNKTIDIRTTFLGESVTTASSERIIELDQLLSSIGTLYNNGEWREVVEKADVLVEIASATALETNNCTYLTYVDSARSYKADAEKYLKLNLYHLKEIEVTETDTKLMTVIAHSDGAPTADYLLETNCSWVTPIQQIVSITQYQRTTVELGISTQNAAPGVYHVNLRLYLPQTNTIVDSLLTIRVVDDDVTPPSITISYSGSQTDGNAGSWNVCVTDGESGLDEVRILVDGTEILFDQTLIGLDSKSYSIPVPATLGMHEIQVTARNNDREWIDDQESSTAVGSVLIEDDDTTPPTLVIEAVDCVSDGQPGYWRVTAEDASGLSQIVLNIDGLEVIYTQEVFGAGTHVELLIPIYNELGVHVCSGYAIDADTDRGAIDQLAVSHQPVYCNIVDDDTSPPQLSNLVISDNIHSVDISLTTIDQSGIGGFVILVNGEIVQPTAMVQDGDNYRFSLANQWILENGIYSLEVVVTDSDNDRPNDALSSSILGSFETSLSEMYVYVGWQIEDLRRYIEGSLDTKLVPSIDHKLSLAYSHLQKALGFIESGRITCCLVHDKAAHVLIKTVEFEIGILCRLGRIGDEDAQHIMDSLRVIRDSIVILMGASTGTEQGYDLALTENVLVNLADLIADEIGCRDGWHLNSLISSAAQKIEEAIFRISLNCDIEGTLSSAQWQLGKAKCEVNQLLNQGEISADLANGILSAIGQAYSNIELIKNAV